MSLSQIFTVTQPTQIQFGAGAIANLGKTVKDLMEATFF